MTTDEEIIRMLNDFVAQAATDNLKTSHYPKYYLDLSIKIGFGQGNRAKVPWIAFLKEGQKVQKGIYPDYLYFRQEKKLFLCFGISETNKPELNWNESILAKYPRIDQALKKPDRYDESLVFREYQVQENKIVNAGNLLEDFKEIIGLYMNQEAVPADKSVEQTTEEKTNDEKNMTGVFAQDLSENGFVFSDKLLLKFIASLVTKPFVILTGLSGSGKTMLAYSFASWICESDKQVCMVPVGADWTSREPLLGYPNALEKGKYVKPDNRVLDLLLEASKPENSDKPYFLILDEMNLSHVERYFADFLSVMESGKAIPLHPETADWKDDVPSEIKLSDNLFIIGTVNIDETTYMFSPKVLDRASVIEFRVRMNDMVTFLSRPGKPDITKLKSRGMTFTPEFMTLVREKRLSFEESEQLNTVLLKFFDELKKIGAEFGYRTASEIYRFVSNLSHMNNSNGKSWKTNEIIDAAIMQKLLPKVHGSRNKLDPVLKTMASLCIKEKIELEKILATPSDTNFEEEPQVLYPLSLEKIIRMRQRAIQDGFTSFAEA